MKDNMRKYYKTWDEAYRWFSEQFLIFLRAYSDDALTANELKRLLHSGYEYSPVDIEKTLNTLVLKGKIIRIQDGTRFYYSLS
jgi:hypothetical protein